MLWSYYLLSVRIVSIQSSELQLGVSEQDEKMRTVASLNLLHHSHACVFIHLNIMTSAANQSIGSTTGCTITEKAPTTAFTFKTLLRHYAKWALTPR